MYQDVPPSPVPDKVMCVEALRAMAAVFEEHCFVFDGEEDASVSPDRAGLPTQAATPLRLPNTNTALKFLVSCCKSLVDSALCLHSEREDVGGRRTRPGSPDCRAISPLRPGGSPKEAPLVDALSRRLGAVEGEISAMHHRIGALHGECQRQLADLAHTPPVSSAASTDVGDSSTARRLIALESEVASLRSAGAQMFSLVEDVGAAAEQQLRAGLDMVRTEVGDSLDAVVVKADNDVRRARDEILRRVEDSERQAAPAVQAAVATAVDGRFSEAISLGEDFEKLRAGVERQATAVAAHIADMRRDLADCSTMSAAWNSMIAANETIKGRMVHIERALADTQQANATQIRDTAHRVAAERVAPLSKAVETLFGVLDLPPVTECAAAVQSLQASQHALRHDRTSQQVARDNFLATGNNPSTSPAKKAADNDASRAAAAQERAAQEALIQLVHRSLPFRSLVSAIRRVHAEIGSKDNAANRSSSASARKPRADGSGVRPPAVALDRDMLTRLLNAAATPQPLKQKRGSSALRTHQKRLESSGSDEDLSSSGDE